MAGEAAKVAVCNSGPLIALAAIDHLTLLNRLFDKVYVPTVVHQELTASRRFVDAPDIFNQPWLHVLSPERLIKAICQAAGEPVVSAAE